MLQTRSRRESLPRIEPQQARQQIDTLATCGGELREVEAPVAHGDLAVGLDVVRQLRDARPVVLGGRADGLADLVELGDLAGGFEEVVRVLDVGGGIGTADEELGEDHAGGPDVDGAGVVAGAVEEFRGPVPDGDDDVGHGVGRVGEGAGEAEVGEFDLPVGGDEEVVGFDVAVEDGVGVDVEDRAEEHAHPGFDVGRAVGDGGIFDEFFQIAVREVFDDHVDVLVFGGEDVEEGDDGWVGDFL